MSLSQAKKFLLVDANQLKPIQDETNFIERTKPLSTRELQNLDKSMLSIVNNPSLSTDDKVQSYNRVLAEFQSVNSNKNFVKVDNFDDAKQDNILPDNHDYDPIKPITNQYKNKATNLFSLLKKSNKITIQPNGEVIIKGTPLSGSNISDLLNKAVNSRTNKHDLPGWNEFEALLDEENIPRFLLNSRYNRSPSSRIIVNPKGIRQTRLVQKRPVYDDWESHDEPKKDKKRTAKKRARQTDK